MIKTIFDLQISSQSQTQSLAQSLAERLAGQSACIELIGDIGAGKTTFCQYFVAALGSQDSVNSPTFTLENIYNAPKNTVHHFDLYRLENPSLIPEELSAALSQDQSIVLIEWPGLLEGSSILPPQRIIIQIQPSSKHQEARRIKISGPDWLVDLDLRGIELNNPGVLK